jgi:hemerythrin family non-heme iron protein
MATIPIPEPFVYSDTFDVQVAVFNEQHKKLFDMIRGLGEDMGNKTKLTELLEYVQLHFKTEEDLFEKHGWATAKSAAHKTIHDKFVSDAVAATIDGVNQGVIDFCKKWLVEHIKLSDMKYSSHMAGKE